MSYSSLPHSSPAPSSSESGPVETVTRWLKQLHMPTLATGVILGVLGIHVVVARPLIGRVAGMQQNMAEINQQLLLLTGHRDDVAASNTLLQNLRTQHDQLVVAGKSVDQVRSLQQNILREARQTGAALAAVRNSTNLQQELIARSGEFHAAAESFQTLADLQARVEGLAEATPARVTAIDEAEAGFEQALSSIDKLANVKTQAIAAVAEIESAEQSIATLVSLRTTIAQQQSELTAAAQTLEQLIGLKSEIVANSMNVQEACQTADSMIAMKDQIAAGRDTIDQARETSDKLVAMQSILIQDGLDLPAAGKNLDTLVAMQNQLKAQTGTIADAVMNLELMTDLQTEFNVQTGKLDGLRRGLTEIVMMESSLARTLRMLEPIATRVSLRRLDDAEIREVARNVIDRRHTQIADNVKKDGFEDASENRLVPTPPAE